MATGARGAHLQHPAGGIATRCRRPDRRGLTPLARYLRIMISEAFAFCESPRARGRQGPLPCDPVRPGRGAPASVTRSMPSTPRWRGCASWSPTRCPARCGCNGGAMRWPAARRGDVAAHPVAAALIETIAHCRLPVGPFFDLIEARVFDLYDDPMPTLADLEGYTGETSAALLQLAALDPRRRPRPGHRRDRRPRRGGLRHRPACCGRFRCTPRAASCSCRSRCSTATGSTAPRCSRGKYTPGAQGGAGRDARPRPPPSGDDEPRRWGRFPPRSRRRSCRWRWCAAISAGWNGADYDPFTTLVQVPQWRRQWTLWRAARQARKMAKPLAAASAPPQRNPAD